MVLSIAHAKILEKDEILKIVIALLRSNYYALQKTILHQDFFAMSVKVVLQRFQYWDGISCFQAKKAYFMRVHINEKHASISPYHT